MKQNEKSRRLKAEVVGSMLRSPELLKARALFKEGKMSNVDFKQVEDKAACECLHIQEDAGVDIVTDGEVRRDVFASQLAQSTEGFSTVSGNWVDWFDMEGNKIRDPVTVAVVSKIKRKRHLSAEEFSFIRGIAKKKVKVTLPSPSMLAYYWLPGVSDKAYPSTDAFLADVAQILKDEVEELVRLGVEYVQFDAPEFGMLIDPHQRGWFEQKGFVPDKLIDDGVSMMNSIIDLHPDITFGVHICKGNDANRFMAKGGYAKIAERVFPKLHAQRLLLEFDDERSGDFECLKFVPDDKIVVLGLISTKKSEMETLEGLQERIQEASRIIPLDRLAVSTQCGFASVAKGNFLSFETQLEKLKLVAEVAGLVWEK